jgi:hypothetical protein
MDLWLTFDEPAGGAEFGAIRAMRGGYTWCFSTASAVWGRPTNRTVGGPDEDAMAIAGRDRIR